MEKNALMTAHIDEIAFAQMTLNVEFEAEKRKHILKIDAQLKQCNGRIEAKAGHQNPKVPVQNPQRKHNAAHKRRHLDHGIEQVEKARPPIRGVCISAPPLV